MEFQALVIFVEYSLFAELELVTLFDVWYICMISNTGQCYVVCIAFKQIQDSRSYDTHGLNVNHQLLKS